MLRRRITAGLDDEAQARLREINSELAIEKSRTAVMRRSVGDAMRENEVLREDYLATYGEDFE